MIFPHPLLVGASGLARDRSSSGVVVSNEVILHGAVAARLDNSGCLVGGFSLTVTGHARRGVVVSNEVILRVPGVIRILRLSW